MNVRGGGSAGWRTGPAAGLLLGMLACAGESAGQDGSAWSGLQRVEPGRSDVSVLAVESKVEPVELRRALGFESLFRGVGEDGEAWFARRDAGVTAVFPRSVYAPLGSQEIALIPPGTTFVIGEPSSILARRLGLEPGPDADRRRDASGGLRLESRMDPTPETEPKTRVERVERVERGVMGLLLSAARREMLGG